jgi:hypothetical protein
LILFSSTWKIPPFWVAFVFLDGKDRGFIQIVGLRG